MLFRPLPYGGNPFAGGPAIAPVPVSFDPSGTPIADGLLAGVRLPPVVRGGLLDGVPLEPDDGPADGAGDGPTPRLAGGSGWPPAGSVGGPLSRPMSLSDYLVPPGASIPADTGTTPPPVQVAGVNGWLFGRGPDDASTLFDRWLRPPPPPPPPPLPACNAPPFDQSFPGFPIVPPAEPPQPPADGDGSEDGETDQPESPEPPPKEPWKLPPGAAEKVPKEFGDPIPNKKGDGWRWFGPKKTGNYVRIDRGQPDSSWPSQRNDHVIINKDGKVIGRDGRPLNAAIDKDPENAHIPLDEWMKWGSWYAP